MRVPLTVTLAPQPPNALQLNPMERVWLDMRERYLSLHSLKRYDATVDACCTASNAIVVGAIRPPCLYSYIERSVNQARWKNMSPACSKVPDALERRPT